MTWMARLEASRTLALSLPLQGLVSVAANARSKNGGGAAGLAAAVLTGCHVASLESSRKKSRRHGSGLFKACSMPPACVLPYSSSP